jgi:DNA replication protein DnaC
MTELVTTRIREHATRLALPHLAEHLDALVARAEADTMGYLEFVDLLLGEEVGLREGRRFRAALKLSGLPHHKGLDEFDFAFQPDLDTRKIRDLAALEFVGSRSNVALLGPPGVGKTHLAVALAVAACSAGYSIYFTSLDEAVRQLRIAEAAGRFAKKLQTYLRPAVLILDEVGYLPLDRAAANMVFQLISRRYERGTVILTSNKTFSQWGSVFADDVLATAILDRLLHHCHMISINGPSYRLKDRVSLTPTNNPLLGPVPLLAAWVVRRSAGPGRADVAADGDDRATAAPGSRAIRRRRRRC